MSDWPRPVENPVYLKRGSIEQWAHLEPPGSSENPYEEADELARIANDLQNQEWYDGDSS